MWLFSRKNKREEVLDETQTDDLLLRAILTGQVIDRKLAMEIPIVSASVDLVCNTFASVPFKLYRKTTDEDGRKVVQEVDDARERLINDDTHDMLDGFQFKKALCEDYLMGRGGYAYIKKTRNQIVGLYYVEENKVTISQNYQAIYKNFDIYVQGVKYNPYEFIKLLRNTKDGASGTGVTTQIGKALTTGFKRLQYEYDLTATGGSRKGFIKSQKHLDDKSIKALKDAWEKYYSGNANTVILNDGLEFQEASNSSQQNEINSKNITFISEIRSIFHISDDNTQFVREAITPIANAFKTALNRDMLLETEKGEYFWDYDLTELLKGTLAERYSAYATAIKSGFATRNEIRYKEKENAIKGLDMVELSLGSVLLDTKTGQIYTPNTGSTVSMDNGMQSVDIEKGGATE